MNYVLNKYRSFNIILYNNMIEIFQVENNYHHAAEIIVRVVKEAELKGSAISRSLSTGR